MTKVNIHIYGSNIIHESRILKETETISKLGIVDEILIIGIWEEGLLEIEMVDATRTILRTKLILRKLGEGTFLKSLKYAEWMLRIMAVCLTKNVTLVNVHQLAALPIGGMVKLFKRARLIYDTHELETERNGWGGGRKNLAKILEKVWIKLVDEIVVVSPSCGDWYEKQYGQPALTVFNAPKYEVVSKQDKFQKIFNIPSEKTIFLYQGTLSTGRGIENILDAFTQAQFNDKVVVFMGYGPLESIITEAAMGHGNIYFHPAVNVDEIVEYTSSADIGFSLPENTSLSYHYSLPNKIFEYAMAEIPVLVSNFGEMKKLVETYKIGYVLDDNSTEGLIRLIEGIDKVQLSMFGSSLKSFKNEFNWENQEQTLSSMYLGTGMVTDVRK